MIWWNRFLRCVIAIVILGSALAVACTLQTPPELPRRLLIAGLVIGAFVLAWLADEVLWAPRKDKS